MIAKQVSGQGSFPGELFHPDTRPEVDEATLLDFLEAAKEQYMEDFVLTITRTDGIALITGNLDECIEALSKHRSKEDDTPKEFTDSGEATDFMFTLVSMLEDERLKDWAEATDSNYGKDSVTHLNAARSAYAKFIEQMDDED